MARTEKCFFEYEFTQWLIQVSMPLYPGILVGRVPNNPLLRPNLLYLEHRLNEPRSFLNLQCYKSRLPMPALRSFFDKKKIPSAIGKTYRNHQLAIGQ